MTQPKILTQLRTLERLHNKGSTNPNIEHALQQILDRELETALRQQQTLATDLAQFEQQYRLSSAEFHYQFHTGQFDDDIDAIEWNACYEIWRSLDETIALLQDGLSP